jgi:hypothetical protein
MLSFDTWRRLQTILALGQDRIPQKTGPQVAVMRIVDLVAIALRRLPPFRHTPRTRSSSAIFVVKDPAPEGQIFASASVIVQRQGAAIDDTIVETLSTTAHGRAQSPTRLPGSPSHRAACLDRRGPPKEPPWSGTAYKDRLGVNGPVKAALMQRHASGTSRCR